MDSIICNDCYKLFKPKETKFVMTSCLRIQCVDCSKAHSCRSKDCQTCRDINFPATMPLDETMPPNALIYFDEPLDQLKKFYKITEFQRQQKDILYQQSKHQVNQYKNLLASKNAELEKLNSDWAAKYAALQSQLRDSKAEIHDLKRRNASLQTRMDQIEKFTAQENRSSAPPRNSRATNEVAPRDLIPDSSSGYKRKSNSPMTMNESQNNSKRVAIAPAPLTRTENNHGTKDTKPVIVDRRFAVPTAPPPTFVAPPVRTYSRAGFNFQTPAFFPDKNGALLTPALRQNRSNLVCRPPETPVPSPFIPMRRNVLLTAQVTPAIAKASQGQSHQQFENHQLPSRSRPTARAPVSAVAPMQSRLTTPTSSSYSPANSVQHQHQEQQRQRGNNLNQRIYGLVSGMAKQASTPEKKPYI